MARLLLVSRRGAEQITLSGATMTEDPSNEKEPAALSFECNGCGQFFESWERLRQHEVDCNADDTENPL